MVKAVSFMLYTFYCNFINKILGLRKKRDIKLLRFQRPYGIGQLSKVLQGKHQGALEPQFLWSQGTRGRCEDMALQIGSVLPVRFPVSKLFPRSSWHLRTGLRERNGTCLPYSWLLSPGGPRCPQRRVSALGTCTAPPTRGSLPSSPPSHLLAFL